MIFETLVLYHHKCPMVTACRGRDFVRERTPSGSLRLRDLRSRIPRQSPLPTHGASRSMRSRRRALGFRRTWHPKMLCGPSGSWFACIPRADARNSHGRRLPCDDDGTRCRGDPEDLRHEVDTDTPNDTEFVERSFPVRCLAVALSPSGRFVPRSVDLPTSFHCIIVNFTNDAANPVDDIGSTEIVRIRSERILK